MTLRPLTLSVCALSLAVICGGLWGWREESRSASAPRGAAPHVAIPHGSKNTTLDSAAEAIAEWKELAAAVPPDTTPYDGVRLARLREAARRLPLSVLRALLEEAHDKDEDNVAVGVLSSEYSTRDPAGYVDLRWRQGIRGSEEEAFQL